MKVTVQKAPEAPGLVENLSDAAINAAEFETVTIDLYKKFSDFIHSLENDGYRVKKIVLHSDLWRALLESEHFNEAAAYKCSGEHHVRQFLGVEVQPERLGLESITDFIIYTDRKVLHSDMVEKTFLEDVDDKQLVDNLETEELLHETNQRIKERENSET